MKLAIVASFAYFALIAAQRPQFDVASIKTNPLGGAKVSVDIPPGRFQATNTPLRFLIRWAYRVAEPRIVGGSEFECGPDTSSRMVAGKGQCGLLIGQSSGSASLRGGGVTLPDFERTLGEYVDRPLVDRTGLTGRYDLELQFTADRSALVGAAPPGGLDAGADSDPAPLPTALREQLGLRLESIRGPVEVLVIDRVSRPTEN